MTVEPPTPSGIPVVSLVVPAWNEEANVPGLLARFDALTATHPWAHFELILVDDGSTDATVGNARRLSEGRDVVVVELARNFGSHQAISAGLQAARGDCAIVLGADAQEPLSLVTEFLEHWQEGYDVIWGVRRTRTRGWASELPSRLFSYLFTRYANLDNYPPEGPSGVLLDRDVIAEVNRLEERNRNVLALIAWLGFRQTRVQYDQLPRVHGTSRWTTARMIKLAVDSLIQFSSMPLRLCTFLGLFVAATGVVYAAILTVRALAGVPTPSGWPTLLVITLLLSGTQLLVIGVMGEYLWRAVEEVRSRPLYVIRPEREPRRPSRSLPHTQEPRR